MLRRPIVIIGIVVLLVIFGFVIFNIDWGGSKQDEQSSTKQSQQESLPEYADSDVKVRMTISGEINSNQDHREVQITVARDSVKANIISGYQGQVTSTQETGNNPSAYGSFLSALDMLGFTRTKDAAAGATEAGSCPQGRRIRFEMYDSNETLLSSWSTSCSTKLGTFAGNLPQVQNLFQAQVPNYNDFVSGVRL